MRTLVAVTFALVSANAPTSQAPVMISGVAKLITTFTVEGESIPVYEYEGVRISGDLLLQDFRDLMTASASRLDANERIEAVSVTKYHPHARTNPQMRDSDFRVSTCQKNCTAVGERGATGRIFIFARAPGGIRLLRTGGFIE